MTKNLSKLIEVTVARFACTEERRQDLTETFNHVYESGVIDGRIQATENALDINQKHLDAAIAAARSTT